VGGSAMFPQTNIVENVDLYQKRRAHITVRDETGALADISIYDVLQSNGVIFSVDRVLMPR
jgi:uncharacterized surface protein with fasciclin (FAS1) repeats